MHPRREQRTPQRCQANMLKGRSQLVLILIEGRWHWLQALAFADVQENGVGLSALSQRILQSIAGLSGHMTQSSWMLKTDQHALNSMIQYRNLAKYCSSLLDVLMLIQHIPVGATARDRHCTPRRSPIQAEGSVHPEP